MPMWAYYANNHQGFCVEYKLSETQKNLIYPVFYEDKRIKGNWIIGNLLASYEKMNTSMSGEKKEDFYFYLQTLFLTSSIKHTSWRHEKEYRIINMSEQYHSLPPNKIYIGAKCKDEYKEQLINIGKESSGKCRIFTMSNKLNSPNFELSAKEVMF